MVQLKVSLLPHGHTSNCGTHTLAKLASEVKPEITEREYLLQLIIGMPTVDMVLR